jgi:hypothetical protein
MKINLPFKLITLLTIPILLSSFQMNAQQTVEISGQAKDEQTKEVLPYSDVIALNAKDSIIQHAMTDEKGFFRLPMAPGYYKFVISAFGYENDTVKPEVYRADKFLGVFKLENNLTTVGEVEVAGSARIDKLDKDVQVVTEELKLGATATKDVLDKIAGISYDEYAGTLKVDNDANIMILVNGVEKSQEYIQNLDPERLVRVETIRDPGGRYGLEGYTAIINVILKRDYKGTEVYLEQMQLVDIAHERNTLEYMIGGLGATYNFTHNDLNIYVAGRAQRKHFKIYTESQTDYVDGVSVLEEAGTADPNAVIYQSDVNYTVGLDYRFNPKHILSFESSFQALPLSNDNSDINYQTSVFSNDTLLEEYTFTSAIKKKTFNSYNSLFYLADFNERTKLNVNFTYSNYKDDYTNSTSQEGYYNREEVGVNKKQFTRGYAELDHIISNKTSFQIGYGNTWRQLQNAFTATITDVSTGAVSGASSDFELTDMRHKLYSNFAWKMNKKWSTRVGLAVETSSPSVAEIKLNYLIYQPMFDLRFAPSKKLNMVLKYRTGSSYPSIAETNPFTSLINPRITSTGNAFLTPSTTHRFSLRINLLQGLLALEPYTHYSTNTVVKVGELDASNLFNFRFENAKLYQRHGGKMNFSKFFRLKKSGIIVKSNVEVYHATIESTSKINSFVDWRADVDLIYMSLQTQALIGLKYQRQQSKMISGLGYDKGDVDFWMMFYKRPLFKKKASIMFGYFFPINLGTNYNQAFHAETDGITMHTDNDVSLVKNMFLLEFSFRISKGKSIKKTDNEIEKEKEESGGGMF